MGPAGSRRSSPAIVCQILGVVAYLGTVAINALSNLLVRLTPCWTLHGRELTLDGTPVASACPANHPVERLVRRLPAAYDLSADRSIIVSHRLY